MNLKQLHTYLGQLLGAGVSPEMTVAALTDEWPNEIDDVDAGGWVRWRSTPEAGHYSLVKN